MGSTARPTEVELLEKLQAFNQTLEKVSLRIKGDRFYVRGSQFPPKPGSLVVRHEIPTGCKVSANGFKLAKAFALEIESKLIRHVFDWAPYLKEKQKPPESVGEWVQRLEIDHWLNTPRTLDKENTFYKNYGLIYRSLPSDAPLTINLLKTTIEDNTEPQSRTRQVYATAFIRLARFAELGSVEALTKLSKGYTTRSVDPKNLPSDEEILEIYHSIKNPGWQWLFGVLAIYGLRNHEAFFLDLSQVNEDLGAVHVLEGKTGDRIAYPCYGKGWDIDISDRVLPRMRFENYSHNKIGSKVGEGFRELKLGIRPYSLRHSFARRMFEQGYSSRLAAKSMGHSVQIHEKVYSAWWGQDAYDRVFRETRDRRTELLSKP